MGMKYFSKRELENYHTQGVLGHGEIIGNDEHGIIYRAILSSPQGHHYVITYIIPYNQKERVFHSGEYWEVYPAPIPRSDSTVMSPEIIEAFAERLKIQK